MIDAVSAVAVSAQVEADDGTALRVVGERAHAAWADTGAARTPYAGSDRDSPVLGSAGRHARPADRVCPRYSTS